MMPSKPRFADLMRRHEAEIHRFVFRMVGNADDAADLLQETFLRAFGAFPRLPARANHRAWLYRIAQRQALNLFRARRARPTAPLDDARGVADGGADPETLSEQRRLARALQQLVRGLAPRQRAALLLAKYEGLSYRDVAAVLGCSQDNARAHVYQAMKKIRNGLRPEGPSR